MKLGPIGPYGLIEDESGSHSLMWSRGKPAN